MDNSKYIKIYYFICKSNHISTYYLKTDGLSKTEIKFILDLDKKIDNERNVEVHSFMKQLNDDLLYTSHNVKYDVVLDSIDLNYEINSAGGCPSILIYNR